jgi:carboxypeptidase C (cathepsin A)
MKFLVVLVSVVTVVARLVKKDSSQISEVPQVSNLRKLKSDVSTSFCSTPVAKGKVNFPDQMVGRSSNSNFDMYSGYVNISTAPDYLFYWFFSTKDGNDDAPLIIWTNGKDQSKVIDIF